MFTKAAILAAALAIPAVTFAQAATTAPAAKKPAATKETKSAVASHTTSGAVKSVSDTQLVITKGSGKNAKDETFTVNASTKKTGDVAAGTKVTVAYTMDGKDMVATSIKAAAPKAAPKAAPAKAKSKN
jgi:hypothetical protein